VKRYRHLGMLVAVLAVLVPAAASPQELGEAVRETYATNESMLSQAVSAAVSELLLGLTAPPGASLLVEPMADHKANWFVESELLSHLADAGYHAYLKEEPRLGPPVPAAADSAAVDTARAAPAPAASSTGTPPDFVLKYRVVLCELTYPEKYRKSPLGSRQVQRRASVSLMARLLEGARENVVWVGDGNVERVNVVPAGKLSLLAGAEFPFNPPPVTGGGVGSLVEPALVTGIVAGLVYLFYPNQN
jgi:hypothetical protein